jgi:ERCC4-type nuclease
MTIAVQNGRAATRRRPRLALPLDLRPESLTIIQDSREQNPFDLSPLKVVVEGLPTGDYALQALRHNTVLERKELGDLLTCCGAERERFEREVQRLLGYEHRLMIVEATWQQLEAGEWRSQVTPTCVISSLLSWMSRGLPIILAGDHQRAGRYAAKWLYLIARKQWRQCRSLVGDSLARMEEADGVV